MNPIIDLIGLEVTDDELEFITGEAMYKFMNFTNLNFIPPNAQYIIDRIVAGDLIKLKYETNSLGDNINYDLVKNALNIQLGDTSVDFGDKEISDEDKLLSLINGLSNEHWKVEALKWRKINW